MDSGAIPQQATQRTHLQVTVPLETLLGLPGAPGGDMEFAPLPISVQDGGALGLRRLGHAHPARLRVAGDRRRAGQARRSPDRSARRSMPATDTASGRVANGRRHLTSATPPPALVLRRRSSELDNLDAALPSASLEWCTRAGGRSSAAMTDGCSPSRRRLSFGPQSRGPD